MAITRWAPFEALTNLERDMQHLEWELHSLLERSGTVEGGPWRPDVDVCREGDSLIVRAELPGIDPEENLEIEVVNDVLQIRGHKQIERQIEERDLYVAERRYGAFARQIPIPDGIDPGTVTASYEHGVLTVRVPLPAIEVQRKIPIRKAHASKMRPD